MVRRRVAIAGDLVALIFAVHLLAGWPDVGSSLDLMSGHAVTLAGEAAFVRLLCWIAVAGVVVVVVGSVPMPSAASSRAARRTRTMALAVAGLTLLGAGVAGHQSGYRVCCANATTTARVHALVR